MKYGKNMEIPAGGGKTQPAWCKLVSLSGMVETYHPYPAVRGRL